MKKVSLIACCVVVLLAIVAGVIFIACTSNVPDKSQPEDAAPLTVNGTWKVVAYSDMPTANVFTYIDNQYIVFKEDGAMAMYVAGSEVLSAKYEYEGGRAEYADNATASFYHGKLKVSEATNEAMPANLTVKRYSDNVIRLVDESKAPREWVIIRVMGDKDNVEPVSSSYIQREWQVELKGRDLADMALKVNASTIEVTGSMETTLGYNWNESAQVMEITGIGTAHTFKPQDNTLILVVVDSTNIVVWQMKLK